MNKNLVFLLLLLLSAAAFCNDFMLVKNGKSTAVFLENGNKAVKTEMDRFNDDLFRCTKTKLPIVKKAPEGAFLIEFKVEKRSIPEEDAFTISFPSSRKMLITCSRFSAGNALRHILEEYMGIRYLFPTPIKGMYGEEINHYPAAENIVIPRKKVFKKASYYLNRTVDYRMRLWLHRWNVRPRILNGHMIPIDVFPVYKYAVDQSWPRNILPILRGKKFIPQKAKAPLPKNIYRAMRGYAAGWNPCFTHPDTTKIAIKNILENIDKDPSRPSVSLGVNDNGGMCECKNCRKAVRGSGAVGRPNYSEIYWKWVDNVAREVTKKYPHIYFSCLAYREVINPPSFKLHKNIVPQICFELNAMDDKEVYARRMKLLKEWKAKVEILDFWDYSYGFKYYYFPRIYFKSHTERLKLLHDHNVRSIFVESHLPLPVEGPKYYLMYKALFDVNVDAEKVVRDWCDTAVGKKAGSYLRKYYDFWEKYWQREELKKTVWYSSRFSTYMRLGDPGSHTFALRQGDMKYLRSLMENVVKYAGTPGEKRRAEILMQLFTLSEDASKVIFSELTEPDGTLKSRKEALLLLKALPEALKAQERLVKNPFAMAGYFPNNGDLQGPMLAQMGSIMPFLKEPAVRKEAEKLSNNKSIPKLLRAMLKIWMGAELPNLIKNGSFETPKPPPQVHWNEGGAIRSAEVASHGTYSFRVPNCTYSFSFPATPGKTYLFLFDAYIDRTSIEGRLNYILTPRKGHRPKSHFYYLNNTLDPKKWTLFSGLCVQSADSDNLQIMFYLRKLEKEDRAYVDNFRAYCLDDFDLDGKTPAVKKIVKPKLSAAKNTLFKSGMAPGKVWQKNPACKRYDGGGTHRFIKNAKEDFLEVKTGRNQIFMYNLGKNVPVKNGSKVKITFRVKGKGAYSINPMGVTREGKIVYLPSGGDRFTANKWIPFSHTLTVKDKKNSFFTSLKLRLNVGKNSSVQIRDCVIEEIQ